MYEKIALKSSARLFMKRMKSAVIVIQSIFVLAVPITVGITAIINRLYVLKM